MEQARRRLFSGVLLFWAESEEGAVARALREAGDSRAARVSARASFWVSRRRPSPPLGEPSLRPLCRLASLVLSPP